MTGAIWIDLETGRREREARRVLSKAWDGWQRRRNRLIEAGIVGKAAVRKIGPEPEQYVYPGGEEDGLVWLPRYTPGLVWSGARAPSAESLPFAKDLRPYQSDAVEAWRRAGGSGILCLPTGAGKTVIACAVIGRCRTPALVLVHTLDLVAQWVERVQEFLPEASVGRWGDGLRETGRVVVATVQTLARMDPAELAELGAGFGLVVGDEIHHGAASTWAWVLAHLAGRYRLGLTATPRRQDGLTEWVEWSVGPVRYTVEQRHLEALGAVLAPRVLVVRSSWEWTGEEGVQWAAIMRDLRGDVERNRAILEVVERETAEGRRVLLLTGSVEHAVFLAESCGGVALSSKVSAKVRRAALGGLADGSLLFVTATQLADEGLDVPALETVVLAWPEKDPGRLLQRIGRALRPGPGKEARVYDVRDAWKPFMGFASKRASLFRKMGWHE
jgi:superfamily II DNA or RNA helicase